MCGRGYLDTCGDPGDNRRAVRTAFRIYRHSPAARTAPPRNPKLSLIKSKTDLEIELKKPNWKKKRKRGAMRGSAACLVLATFFVLAASKDAHGKHQQKKMTLGKVQRKKMTPYVEETETNRNHHTFRREPCRVALVLMCVCSRNGEALCVAWCVWRYHTY